ncbi:MAG: tRNA nucleotidyl transferase [Proteobacteria bacterium]|uniref:tRNA nucleotidyl transferase n=1 Tax=SAR86 cluster bacterium TaxID=2030880 RepID=A0A937IJN6_9GAMM|nr:tRNA nucleotidyl transferase [SAR86 cluster bacterium]MBL6819932.1 tRNA nucleotidyl transferase [SAR86 cluster bacterium]MDA0344581.1 tRNA nucleotidyl transferase [Pseudomonadota bacterium]MDA0899785.1 tRNA nucleotidyl transferase [Pseudomonadota bacterium]MDA1056614.1 tRNA nucleotidyl transferase [Pseudomonadota bacterium]
MKIYKVGGAVRDHIMGIRPNDCDWVVVGSTPEQMKSLGYKQVGADFPVFLHPETNEEYALARTEKKTGKGYSGFSVQYEKNISLEEDLLRRDLTINSIAMSEDGQIIDPYNGVKDIKNKILRHTSEAFYEDPLRALRLGRFKTKFNDFVIHEDTTEALSKILLSGEIAHLTKERVLQEVKKGFEINPLKYLQNIMQLNLSTPWFDDLTLLPETVSNDFVYSWCQISQLNDFNFAHRLLESNHLKTTLNVWQEMHNYSLQSEVDDKVSFFQKMTSPKYDKYFVNLLPHFDLTMQSCKKIYEEIKAIDFSYLANLDPNLLYNEKKNRIKEIVEKNE